MLILHTLRRGGYVPEAQRVDNARDLRAALQRQAWDLVISDYVIPGFGGLAALALVKEQADVPFIMVSGQMGEDTAVTAMKAGAHDYLLKDHLARLAPAIRRELDEAEVRRARKQAQAALRESEERFRQLAENIDAAFFMSEAARGDELGRVAYASPAYEAIWGRPCQSLYADPHAWLEAVHPDDLPRVRAAVPRLAQGEFSEQFRLVRPDASTRWVHYRAFPVRNEQGEIYRIAAIAEDITERKHAEEKLAANAVELRHMIEALEEARQTLERRVQERTADLRTANANLRREIEERRRLENELLEITEKERRRIGIDLHDDLGQHLNGIALLLEALLLKLTHKKLPEAADVERIKALLHKTMNHAHEVARDLASVDVQGEDLAAVLRTLATQAGNMFDVCCRLKCDRAVPPLPANVVSQLYKIAQEAVTNAIKHGKAKQIQISLVPTADELTLSVRNDGVPFPESPGLTNRMGLRIMNYRAHLIGAQLEIKGEGKRGTLVTCSLPLRAS